MVETRRDDGFTLIEIMVALGIFLVVTMALLPQMVAGIRAVSTADRETALKGVLQQEVDRLRGLPYRVSLGSSGVGTDADVDLLDLYFPNVSHLAPTTLDCEGATGYLEPTASWAGYIAGTGGPTAHDRCNYEPAIGVFYRTVTSRTDPRLGSFWVVRDVQFLSGGSTTTPTPTALAPRSTYDSDRSTTNYPPSSQVGVTVTVMYQDQARWKASSIYTQIAKHDVGPTLVRTSVDVDAVEITSLSPEGAAMSLTAGVVGLDSSVGDISSATASLAAVVARVATGDPSSSQFGYGATSTIAAPPTVPTFTPVPPDVPDWGPGGCANLLCWGTSEVGSDAGTGVLADGGLPRAGELSSQLRSSVSDIGPKALSFDNVGAATSAFNLSGPVARLVGASPGTPTITDPVSTCPLGVNAGARLSGSGYLTTALHNGSETLRDTSACGSARSAAIGIMPIGTWAPDGVVKVILNRSYAWCEVVGGTATGDSALSVSVQLPDGNGDYQAAVDAGTIGLETTIPGGHGKLGDYLQGWSLGTQEKTVSGGKVTTTMPGMVVTTRPTREMADGSGVDENSAVVVTLGAASCTSASQS